MTRPLHALRCALSLCALASVACARAALGPAPPTAIPTTYAIRLHRAQKAGDRGRISTVVRSRRAMVMVEGDQIVKREEKDREIELEAIVKVLRIGAAGEPLDLEYTIESLTMQTPAGRTQVLPRGRVVTAERGRDKVLFHAAEPLSPEAAEALGEIVPPHGSDTTDDDIFGTKEPQAIGAIWPVNAALAAKELGDGHLDIPAEAVHGQTHLVGLAQAAGQICLAVAGELSVSDPRLANVPGARPETAELHSKSSRLLPVDTTQPEVDGTLSVDVDVAVIVPLGPNREARMTTTSHKEKRQRFTPLP